jgi:hypothetical protein
VKKCPPLARRIAGLSTCIGCGCDEHNACYDPRTDNGCYWLRLDQDARLGVCSQCEAHVEAWDRGERIPYSGPA